MPGSRCARPRKVGSSFFSEELGYLKVQRLCFSGGLLDGDLIEGVGVVYDKALALELPVGPFNPKKMGKVSLLSPNALSMGTRSVNHDGSARDAVPAKIGNPGNPALFLFRSPLSFHVHCWANLVPEPNVQWCLSVPEQSPRVRLKSTSRRVSFVVDATRWT